MCHHHYPGEGIETLGLDLKPDGGLVVGLDCDDCHYILPTQRVLHLLGNNKIPIPGYEPPALTTTAAEPCHRKGFHIHEESALVVCEMDPYRFAAHLEVSATGCSCHDIVPRVVFESQLSTSLLILSPAIASKLKPR